jgi:D-beta-D-heptose 7-phosphate kinase/D-beta-D-heptose 1-phosphate adenosyltransferase
MTRERAEQLVQRCAGKRALVVGDLMLDEFLWGNVSRISPEAPVPVVEVTRESSVPGGAANVARNLREFTSNVAVFGQVGRDAAGETLLRLLGGAGISTNSVLVHETCPTAVKTRIIARHQQVVRYDREKRFQATAAEGRAILSALSDAVRDVDAVVVADYNKGFVAPDLAAALGRLAVEKQALVAIDPHPGNPLGWHGPTVVKPNYAEACAFLGLSWESVEAVAGNERLEDMGGALLRKWNAGMVLLTLGEHGMLLFRPGRTPFHVPARAREVFDVSGAGDTAIALLALALAAGATAEEAAELSNHASGVVVGKLGTATVTPEELLESFR